MTQHNSKKKPVQYYFVDINDPDRYKKLKVARACEFCRKRKSKCDVGVPGSGTCSNCKKSKKECVFSPVSSTSNKNITSRQQKKSSSSHLIRSKISPVSPSNTSPLTSANDNSTNSNSSNSSSSFTSNTIESGISLSPSRSGYSHYGQHYPSKNTYQTQNSIFSINARGFCNYEVHTSSIYNHMIFTTSMVDLPQFSDQMEKDLFHIYFEYVHPLFPVLNRFYVSHTIPALPSAMKLAIMAIAMNFTHHQDAEPIAAALYHHAMLQLDHTPSLSNIQTLILLFKFQEIITSVGLPLSVVAVNFLKEAQSMLVHQYSQVNDPITEEFLYRAGWILFVIISLSSSADDRWFSLLDNCEHPKRFPALTEREQYDKTEVNITCNFIHLINITIMLSQTLCLMARHGTLFVTSGADYPEFRKIATKFRAWKSGLPSHITASLAAANTYSDKNHHLNSRDDAKTSSFISYLGLLYDTLELLIDLHQPNVHDIFNKAVRISYRAHSFTIGDMLGAGFLRKASIQGTRFVCFGLTLATQAQSVYLEEKQHNASFDDIKKFYSICSLSFQILDDIPLSSQLYVTIQSLRHQLKSKEQLAAIEQQNHQSGSAKDKSNQSSNHSTPTTQDDRSVSYDSSQTNYLLTPDLQQQQPTLQNYPRSMGSVPPEDRQWQYYNQEHHYNPTDCQHTMTPEFDQEVLTPDLETLSMNADSYFDHLPQRRPIFVPSSDPCVAVAFQRDFNYVSVNIQFSKSCKNHEIL